MGILAAFLKDQSRADDAVDPPTVVQAAFTALAKRRTRYDRGWAPNLEGADLRRIKLDRARLRRANLRHARLDGAFLQRSDLREAHLDDAWLLSTRLDEADLKGAFFSGAKLEAATLDHADARGAEFDDAELSATFMRYTDLRGASGLEFNDDCLNGAHADGAKHNYRLPLLHPQSRRVRR